MGSTQHKPGMAMHGMDKPAARMPESKEGHDAMAMAKPRMESGRPPNAQTARIIGTGSVKLIDRVNGKVKLTHDPIAAMGWPKMTMFFRLKDSSLADQVKAGDRVEFSLEKSASGYVVSGFQKLNSESNLRHKK
jgi:Cu/Ag efflux protein CusF